MDGMTALDSRREHTVSGVEQYVYSMQAIQWTRSRRTAQGLLSQFNWHVWSSNVEEVCVINHL